MKLRFMIVLALAFPIWEGACASGYAVVTNYYFSSIREIDVSSYGIWKKWRTEDVYTVECNGRVGETYRSLFTREGAYNRSGEITRKQYTNAVYDTYTLAGGELITVWTYDSTGAIRLADTNSISPGGQFILPRPLVVGKYSTKSIDTRTRVEGRVTFALQSYHTAWPSRVTFFCRDQDGKDFSFFIRLKIKELKEYTPTLQDASWGAGYKVRYFEIRNISFDNENWLTLMPFELVGTGRRSV